MNTTRTLVMVALVTVTACNRTPAPDPQPTPVASASAKPHRKPPPPKTAKLPGVALPGIAAHAPSQAAGSAPTSQNPCGTVIVADGEVPLDCLDPAGL